jgi:hypothetical protein
MQIREQEARLAPYAEAFKRVAPEATKALEEHVKTLSRQHEAQRQRRAEYERLGLAWMQRAVGEDEEHRRGIELFHKDVEQSIVTLRKGRAVKQSRLSARLTVQPLGGGTLGGPVPEDETIACYVPPYADQWTDMEGGSPTPHQQQETWASKGDGKFGFLHTIGKEGGSAYSAAAVWVEFVPRRSSGQLQVRAYTPYSFVWHDKSYVATAHNDGSFGVYVLSWDTNGNDRAVEQDYSYSIWSDGTGWYDDHSDSGGGYAFQYGHEAPYFDARSNRIYRAGIWCFGSCDAHGADVLSASYAQAKIEASVPYVVIGQQ